MLPLSAAIARFNKNAEVDNILLLEYERRVSQEIEEAVDAGRKSVKYVVRQIPGPYPPTDVLTIATKLIDKARLQRYEAHLISTIPPVVEIRGWVTKTRAPSYAAAAAASAAAAAAVVGARARQPVSRPAARRPAAQQDLVIVHESPRKLSEQLKKRLQRINS